MKVQTKNENGEPLFLNVTSLVITLSNGETIEISDEMKSHPDDASEGVIVWGGRMPKEGASLDELKASTRGLGIYPLAANMIHLFPRSLRK